MAKKKQVKTEITIHSKETKVFIGIILFVLGLATLLTPFLDAPIFTAIQEYLGYSSILWGFSVILFSIRTIKNENHVVSYSTILGAIIGALTSNILLTFFIPDEKLVVESSFADSGGVLGYILHTRSRDIMGEFIEFLLIIVAAIIAFSLLSGVSLEKITNGLLDAVLNFFGRFKGKVLKDGGQAAIDIVNSSKRTIEDSVSGFVDEPVDDDGFNEVPVQNSNSSMSQKAMNDHVEFISGDDIDTSKVEAGQSSDSESEETGLVSEPKYLDWKFPPTSLLKPPVINPPNEEIHKRNAVVIEKTLRSFGIESRMSKITIGPTVVQYALSITVGTKVAKVRNLSNDLALALATSESQIRIEAPIPGTSLIGIEIPNPTPNFVYIREMAEDLVKTKEKYTLPIILGKSVAGSLVIKELSSLPHLLVAGATGSGKSAGINSILTGFLMTMSPDQLRLILIDPKMVEMAPYNGIPHLLTPVITDMELVVNALQWSVEEMLRRYRILKQVGARNITEYNKKSGSLTMPYIVLIIDEMADLMLTTGVDVESKIVRLTQMARAVGIHLILATQRPSVDVITGLIKANVPGRIAFAVSTAIDSRVIIDQSGAETLIGKGDLLFRSPQTGRPVRLQGAFTDTADTENLVGFIKNQTKVVEYSDDVVKPKVDVKSAGEGGDFSEDTLFRDALEVVVNAQKASASLLQRKLRIGYNRAARLIDELYEAGAIGPQEGSNPRKVLVSTVDQFFANDPDGGPLTGSDE